jgi:hypothetical protein
MSVLTLLRSKSSRCASQSTTPTTPTFRHALLSRTNISSPVTGQDARAIASKPTPELIEVTPSTPTLQQAFASQASISSPTFDRDRDARAIAPEPTPSLLDAAPLTPTLQQAFVSQANIISTTTSRDAGAVAPDIATVMDTTAPLTPGCQQALSPPPDPAFPVADRTTEAAEAETTPLLVEAARLVSLTALQSLHSNETDAGPPSISSSLKIPLARIVTPRSHPAPARLQEATPLIAAATRIDAPEQIDQASALFTGCAPFVPLTFALLCPDDLAAAYKIFIVRLGILSHTRTR